MIEHSDVWDAEVSRLKRTTGVSMVFGGPVTAGALRLDHFDGAISGALCGLHVYTGAGLGGKVVRESRMVSVADYASAQSISHDFDVPVGAEGLRTVIGVPVVVNTHIRGVVYAGTRGHASTGDRLLGSTELAARRLAERIALDDEVEREVERRLAARLTAERHRWAKRYGVVLPDGARESVGPAAGSRAPAGPTPHLTPRQVEVLAGVASGEPYAQVAQCLGLSAGTVKSHMRDILRELGVHGRHAAVVEARRLGLLH